MQRNTYEPAAARVARLRRCDNSGGERSLGLGDCPAPVSHGSAGLHSHPNLESEDLYSELEAARMKTGT